MSGYYGGLIPGPQIGYSQVPPSDPVPGNQTPLPVGAVDDTPVKLFIGVALALGGLAAFKWAGIRFNVGVSS